MKSKTKKKVKKKLTPEQEVEQEMVKLDKDYAKNTNYPVPEPSKIIKIFELGNGAIAILRKDDDGEELVYMNTNLKFPISL